MPQLILVGGGHAHIQVLKHFRDHPPPDLQLTLVSDNPRAAYSGMLPGLIAGIYEPDETSFDLVLAATKADCRFVLGSCIDVRRHGSGGEIGLDTGETIAFDFASLNVGITPNLPLSPLPAGHYALKPIGSFYEEWREALREIQKDPDDEHQITINGGGAAGFEIAHAIHQALRKREIRHRITLVERETSILSSHSEKVRTLAKASLAEIGVDLREGSQAILDGDFVFWATEAAPPAWLRNTEMTLSKDGYVRVENDLRVVDWPTVFGAGDCIAFPTALPKSGVYAVRQGPILAHNLAAAMMGGQTIPFEPQAQTLALLSLSNGEAIFSRGSWGLRGRWAFRLKDHIDRAFMQRWQ